jgi:hypothetical protein
MLRRMSLSCHPGPLPREKILAIIDTDNTP